MPTAAPHTPHAESVTLEARRIASFRPAMKESADGCPVPESPRELAQVDVDPAWLCDLALKLADRVPQLTTEWAAAELCLPIHVVEEIFWQLKHDQLVEVLGQDGPFNYRYAIMNRGRERAAHLLEICGYVGPAPVSLAAYTARLTWQADRFPAVSLRSVQAALAELALLPRMVEVAALAASSGRSLFLFGPSGNGKSSLARILHRTALGDLWIPHCIAVGSTVIRLFDAQCHELVRSQSECGATIDRRWVRIRRPLVVAAGEMTARELDLIYSPALGFYEAPPHVKANGGTFLLDDFGRQRMTPQELVNRWIIPLEHQVDYLSLKTGQKVQLPFRLMLVVSTNLEIADVTDPAFLRRMGYRLRLDPPDGARYAQILRDYAAHQGIDVAPGVVDRLLQRYVRESRELRCSEPRDLIERVRDLCRLRESPPVLTDEVLEAAWEGYFGNT